jgi:Zn-dependent membrane protease YugP
MFYFDPMYLMIVGPFMLLGLFAQFKVKSTFAKYSKIRASSGVTGAQAAQRMLDTAGIRGTRIEQVSGFLSDHYDPRTQTVRLSPEVYGGTSVAALGIACHEVGHAMQHAQNYGPLVVRNAAVPMASIGPSGGVLLFFIGMLLSSFSLALAGLILFAGGGVLSGHQSSRGVQRIIAREGNAPRDGADSPRAGDGSDFFGARSGRAHVCRSDPPNARASRVLRSHAARASRLRSFRAEHLSDKNFGPVR